MHRYLLLVLLTACPSSAGDDDDAASDRCAPDSPAAASACVDAAAYRADLELLAVERDPGSAGHQAAQDHCRSVLSDLGFAVEDHAYGTGTNIVGTKAGTDPSRRQVILSAHYDGVPGCAAADDNASGVAGALGAARALAGGTWAHDLVIACWDEEERGLLGARAYADRAAGAGDAIDVAVSLEMIAYKDSDPNTQALPLGFDQAFPEAAAAVQANDSRGDFIGVVADPAADPFSDAFVEHAPGALTSIRIDIPQNLMGTAAVRDLSRSDHAAFWDAGFAGVMLTDTADFRYPGYHCGDGSDTVARLDLDFAVDVTRAVAAAAAARLSAE